MNQPEELAAAALELSEEELEKFKAAFVARLTRWRSLTGFGHAPGSRIILSDRTYEVASNGKYPDGTPKNGSYRRVA